MDFKITSQVLFAPPQVAPPAPEFLNSLREEGIRQMVSDHYDLLVESSIKNMFPRKGKGLEMAKEKSADFFIQLCGGHPHYSEKRGNPMMRKRHMPFKISDADRVVWLECYKPVLENLDAPESAVMSFWNFLNIFSQWMVVSHDRQ